MTQLLKTSKKVFAFVLAFAILSMSLFTGVMVSAEEATDTIYATAGGVIGDGEAPTKKDADGAYIISTVDHFIWLVNTATAAETKGNTYKVADGIKNIILQPKAAIEVAGLTTEQFMNLTLAEVKEKLPAIVANGGTDWSFRGDVLSVPAISVSVEKTVFAGTFDGNGATIYGASGAPVANKTYYQTHSVFGTCGDTATIKNVIIKNSYLRARWDAAILVSGVVKTDAEATAPAEMTIENCVITNNWATTDDVSTNNKDALGNHMNSGIIFSKNFAGWAKVTIQNNLIYGNKLFHTKDSVEKDLAVVGWVNSVGDTVNDGSDANKVGMTKESSMKNNIFLDIAALASGTRAGNLCDVSQVSGIYTDCPNQYMPGRGHGGQTVEECQKAYEGKVFPTPSKNLVGKKATAVVNALNAAEGNANAWKLTDGYPMPASLVPHICTVSEEWSSDKTGHWHACAECTKKHDEAAHEYDSACDNTCNVCGYVDETRGHKFSGEDDAFCDNGCGYIRALKEFPDVAADAWFYEPVNYVVGKGMMKGYGGTDAFGAANNLKREEFIIMLARYAGVDLDAYEAQESQFSDVPEGEWFEGAINWGAEKGIITGYGDSGVFGVGDTITREQLVLMLCRYAEKVASKDVSVGADAATNAANRFVDFGNVSDWATDAVLWAVENGVITGAGVEKNLVNPQGNAQRCEIAQIMYNIYKNAVL